jgi:hypothetical protein
VSEEKDKEKSVQDQAKLLSEAVKLVLENAKQSEWASVNAPFTQTL